MHLRPFSKAWRNTIENFTLNGTQAVSLEIHVILSLLLGSGTRNLLRVRHSIVGLFILLIQLIPKIHSFRQSVGGKISYR